MLFCLGFLFQFLIAGLTGIMLAAVPFDWQLSDSYFVVAHFHYVLIGALVFTIFARDLLLVPQGDRQDALRDGSGSWHFWLFVDRLPPHVRHHAHPRPARHAAAHLHLRGRPRLGALEPDQHGRRASSRPSAIVIFLWNVIRSLRLGPAGGQRPLGRLDARVGDQLAAAALQLRDCSPWCAAGGRSGTSSIPRIRTGSTSNEREPTADADGRAGRPRRLARCPTAAWSACRA